MKDKILKHALLNAISYKGKASAKVVLNKLLSELPHLKDKIKVIIKDIEKVVKEVNKLSHEEQKNQLESLGIKQEIKKPQERQIPDLINVKNKVVMRFAPNPNGPLSLGHCRPALWNWFFVQKYKGTYILRFDDTDPKVKIPIKEAYDWIKEDLVWLGVKPTKIVIQSSRLKTYYKYAEELIKLDGAYVCTCSPESWKKLVDSKKPCICRSLKKEENLKRFKSMFKTYKEGEAVLRIKTDISHPNPAIRDWPAFRIVDKSNHPLSKEKVWPLLNFASAIDDHEFKVTHILRGIDLSISDDRQKYIYNYFKWTYPETMYNGKLLVSGIKSSSEAREMISKGELSGWDDPRLGTIKALR
ncbi:MAG: glutamate--tRNA ligase, partial [Candidatus Woesearchaeota archaeon]